MSRLYPCCKHCDPALCPPGERNQHVVKCVCQLADYREDERHAAWENERGHQ